MLARARRWRCQGGPWKLARRAAGTLKAVTKLYPGDGAPGATQSAEDERRAEAPSLAGDFRKRAAFELDRNPFDFKGGPHMWREFCRDRAKVELEAAGLHHLEREVKVVIRFFVRPSNRPRDLDNMIKTLIDALGAAGLFKRSRGGGRRSQWNTDDDWITAISAEKFTDADRPRVDVEVWTREEER